MAGKWEQKQLGQTRKTRTNPKQNIHVAIVRLLHKKRKGFVVFCVISAAATLHKQDFKTLQRLRTPELWRFLSHAVTDSRAIKYTTDVSTHTN